MNSHYNCDIHYAWNLPDTSNHKVVGWREEVDAKLEANSETYTIIGKHIVLR